MVAIGCAFYVGRTVGSTGSTTLTQTQQTVILERIRAMGDLRTAEASYSDLIDHRSWQTPGAEWSAVPGVASLVRAGTENRHVVKTTGKVEAGFDLSQARIASTSPGSVVVFLPPVHYMVRIEDAQAVESKRALFWRNENGNFEAERAAKNLFLESAKQSRLSEDAERNAEKLLQVLLSSFGVNTVEVRVQTASTSI